MGLSRGAKARIKLGFVSTILMLLGAWVVFPILGWRGIGGLFLLLWGNNIAAALQHERDRERLKLNERLLKLAERLTQ